MSYARTASILTVVLLNAASFANAAESQVAASFERMLHRETTHAVAVTTIGNEPDVVTQLVASALGPQWSPRSLPGANPRATNPDDQIAASFARMLDHSPSRSTPAIPAGLGDDPLLVAVVIPLREQGGLNPVGPLYAVLPKENAQH